MEEIEWTGFDLKMCNSKKENYMTFLACRKFENNLSVIYKNKNP